jgi:RNA polymerase sigma factor (sigma-70 family)
MAISILKKYKLPVTDKALQESYLGMCEAGTRYDPERSKFTTYSWKYIRHRLCAHYGGYSNAWPKRGLRLKRYLIGKTIDADCLKNDIGYSVNGNESKVIRKDLVYKALRSLTSDQHQSIYGYYFEGLSCIEMDTKYGFTRRTHNSRISKSLARMREALST